MSVTNESSMKEEAKAKKEKSSIDRRDFLKLSSSAALLGACSQVEQPVKKLIPLVIPSDDVVPGKATWYASTCVQCPSGCGISVKIQEGQAKKIAGNPDSPINRGKLCSMGESALQVLYNPDRIKKPLQRVGKRGAGAWEEISWEKAFNLLASEMKQLQAEQESDRLYFISSPIRGRLSRLISQFMEGYGTPHVYHYALFDHAVQKAANALCFGVDALGHEDIAETDFLLSFGADFLERWRSPVSQSVAYGEFRQSASRQNRGKFIHLSARLSLTAANADQWLAIQPGTEGLLALSLSHVILNEGRQTKSLNPLERDIWQEMLSKYSPEKVAQVCDVPEQTIRQLALEFASSPRSLALCGENATAQKDGLFHAVAVNILNYLSGNIGKKGGLTFYPPYEGIEEKRLNWQRIKNLSQEIDKGVIKLLLLHDANLLFHAPEELALKKSFEKLPFIAAFSSFLDETTSYADLILPLHTPLESFGDYIPEADGGHRSVSFMQPVVAPLYDTLPLGDIFLKLAPELGEAVSDQFPQEDFERYLKEHWEEQFFVSGLEEGLGFGIDFRPYWNRLLQQGGRWDNKTSEAIAISRPDLQKISKILKGTKLDKQGSADNFKLQLYPSLNLYDGRGANQPWLQEAPDPMTTITWGSWIEIHPDMAKKLGVKEGDLLQIATTGGSIEAPAYPTPGIRPDTLAMPIGQGHTDYGRYAKGRGSNPLSLLSLNLEAETASLAWASIDVSIKKTGRRKAFAKTEGVTHHIGHHDLVLSISGDEARQLNKRPPLEVIEALPGRSGIQAPGFLPESIAKHLKPEMNNQSEDYRWGMAIDLDRCTGCGACNVACHAENNLPSVGEDAVKNQREINWMRLERYWGHNDHDDEAQQAMFLPMLCQQCGNAPCEPVCPVTATYHTPDGLNAQVYNRCVGTRYCGVNCPYKVRAFNWSEPAWPKPLDRKLSPDLSVRQAGIMEKCTFCVQRIRSSKEDAKIEKRQVKDGEIQPACVQSCPSNAMVFGSLLDHKSEVSKASRDPRRYRALEHLNTEPAVIYLKRIIDI